MFIITFVMKGAGVDMKPSKTYAEWHESLGHHEIAEIIVENILDIECVNLACWLRDFYPEKLVEWAEKQRWYEREMHNTYEGRFSPTEEE